MISVIIPYVKNRGFLNETLLSLLAQTYQDFEIIHAKGKRTQGANINRGLVKAKGEYIKILHDDDILPPDSLANLHEGIQGYDWVCGDMQSFGDLMYCDPKVYKGCQPDLSRMILNNEIYGGTTLYRKDVLNAIGGYNEKLHTGEEYELHLRLLHLGHSCNYIPVVTHNYRFHEHNKSYFMGPGEKKERKDYIKEIASWYQ